MSTKKNRTTFRCDPILWDQFRKRCEDEGSSSCAVLESLVRAVVLGTDQKLGSTVHQISIALTIDYKVERRRRTRKVVDDSMTLPSLYVWDSSRGDHGRFVRKDADYKKRVDRRGDGVSF